MLPNHSNKAFRSTSIRPSGGAGRWPLIWLERAVMNVAGAAAGDYDEWAIKSISSRSPLADRLAWLAIYSWGCPRKSREP